MEHARENDTWLVVHIKDMNDLNFTPLQQRRFDQAQQDYWKEPNCAVNRNNPRFKDECTMFATWAARADVMSENE